ncbi:BPSL0761 family protein [Pseudomonas sp.]|uniref:BPSL0761 family protein n=1 Tax=Pseudomonas sp. TaxID=306 RepID=UPI0025801421|nr:BPSL0761 family protein [Pseudomonas sp.]
MTLPYERTRAIVKTEDFLRELSRDGRLPQDIRSYAKSLLRHYPSAAEVFSLGRLEECLASDTHDDEYRRRVIAFHQPLLCSSLEKER